MRILTSPASFLAVSLNEMPLFDADSEIFHPLNGAFLTPPTAGPVLVALIREVRGPLLLEEVNFSLGAKCRCMELIYTCPEDLSIVPLLYRESQNPPLDL